MYNFTCGHYVLNSLGYIPMSGITGLYGNSFTFWRTAKLLSKVAAPFHIPTSNARGLQFLHMLANSSYCLFDYSHLNGYEGVSHCSFDLPSPNSIEHLFKCCCGIFMLAALKSFSENSNISVILIVPPIDSSFSQFEIFLVLGIMSNFLLKPGNFAYYVIKFWILCKPYSLDAFLWHYSGRGKGVGETTFYYSVWVEVQVYHHLASKDSQVGSVCLLTSVQDGSSSSPLVPLGREV